MIHIALNTSIPYALHNTITYFLKGSLVLHLRMIQMKTGLTSSFLWIWLFWSLVYFSNPKFSFFVSSSLFLVIAKYKKNEIRITRVNEPLGSWVRNITRCITVLKILPYDINISKSDVSNNVRKKNLFRNQIENHLHFSLQKGIILTFPLTKRNHFDFFPNKTETYDMKEIFTQL